MSCSTSLEPHRLTVAGPRRLRMRMGALLASLVVSVVVGLGTAANASAFSDAYCAWSWVGPIAQGTLCGDTGGYHLWTYNQSNYYGTGTVSYTCGGLWSGSFWRNPPFGNFCTAGNIDSDQWNGPDINYLAYVWFYDSNGAPHSIYGYAYGP